MEGLGFSLGQEIYWCIEGGNAWGAAVGCRGRPSFLITQTISWSFLPQTFLYPSQRWLMGEGFT